MQSYSSVHLWDQPLSSYKGKIPFIISDLIFQLKKMECYKVEGIFRQNGAENDVKKLISALDNGRVTDWSCFTDVHSLTSTLKKYCVTLSESSPLIQRSVTEKIIQIVKDEKDLDVRLLKIEHLLHSSLPSNILKILKFMSRFLYKLTRESEINKMDTGSMAICVGFCLVDRNSFGSDIKDNAAFLTGFECILKHCKYIFREVKLKKTDFCTQSDIEDIHEVPDKWLNILHQMEKAKSSIQEGVIPTVLYITQLIDNGMCHLKRPVKPLPVPSEHNSSKVDNDDDYYDTTSVLDELYSLSSNNRTCCSSYDILSSLVSKLSMGVPSNQNVTEPGHQKLNRDGPFSINMCERLRASLKSPSEQHINIEDSSSITSGRSSSQQVTDKPPRRAQKIDITAEAWVPPSKGQVDNQ